MNNAVQLTFFEFINLALLAGGTVMGWFLKVLFSRIEQLEKTDHGLLERVTEIQVALPSHYVSKQDFKSMGDDIFGVLRRIEDKLDGKADKQ